MGKRFWTPREVATLLGVHRRTVHRWIHMGELRSYRFGRQFKIPDLEVARLVSNANITKKDRTPLFDVTLANDLV